MAAVSASDIARAVTLAWQVYNYGWSEDGNANAQYRDFGNDVRNLARNLENVYNVVANAENSWRQRLPGEKSFDLSALSEIIGDYQRTIRECDQVLKENRRFALHDNFAFNIQFNVLVEPRVRRLKERIQFHSTKILVLLKPLEIQLLSDVHDSLAARLDAQQRTLELRLDRIEGLLVADVQAAKTERDAMTLRPLEVPDAIAQAFFDVAQRGHPEIRVPGLFPLQAGADALVFHFGKSTKNFLPGVFVTQRRPPVLQYLSLLKCVWILEKIKSSSDLRNTRETSTWSDYIKQLDEDVCRECERFNVRCPNQLLVPDIRVLNGPKDFSIWLEDEIFGLLSIQQETTMTEEVLKLPLDTSSNTSRKELVVHRSDEERYRMVESVTDRRGQSTRAVQQPFDFNLHSVCLKPLYAIPGTSSNPLTVEVEDLNRSMKLDFVDVEHIFKLQNVITGYKVYNYYDQPGLKITAINSGNKKKDVKYLARLQLWLCKPVLSRTTNAGLPQIAVQSPSETSFFAPSSNIQRSAASSLSHLNTMSSMTSGGSGLSNVGPAGFHQSFGSSPAIPRPPTSPVSAVSSSANRSLAASVFSTSSRTSVTSVTTISTGSGTGLVYNKPVRPLLVLYLQNKDTKQLSLAAIELDDQTFINREACYCWKAKNSCDLSSVERTSGNLRAQYYEALNGWTGWDVASLGLTKKKPFPDKEWKGVKRLSIRFPSAEARESFAGKPCKCNTRMTDGLKKCVRKKHRGLFGEIHALGAQQLRIFNNQRARTEKANFTDNPVDPLGSTLPT